MSQRYGPGPGELPGLTPEQVDALTRLTLDDFAPPARTPARCGCIGSLDYMAGGVGAITEPPRNRRVCSTCEGTKP